MALVWLNKAGPLDALELHAKVDNTLHDHGYAPVALSDVSTALSNLRAQNLIADDEPGSSRFVAAESGVDLIVHALNRMTNGTKPDGYAVACILSQEARV